MVDLSVQDPDTFKSEYHQRSIIEAVFGAIKKMYGNHTRCHKPENQCREIAIRIICYDRGQIEGKGRQAHTEDDRYHDCMRRGRHRACPAEPAHCALELLWFG